MQYIHLNEYLSNNENDYPQSCFVYPFISMYQVSNINPCDVLSLLIHGINILKTATNYH